jgi:hypothetical protein
MSRLYSSGNAPDLPWRPYLFRFRQWHRMCRLSLQINHETLLSTTASVTSLLISHSLITLSLGSCMLVRASDKALPYIASLVCEWFSHTCLCCVYHWCHGYRVSMVTMEFGLYLISDFFCLGCMVTCSSGAVRDYCGGLNFGLYTPLWSI